VEAAVRGADAVVVATEAAQFKALKPATVKRLARHPLVLDGRRVLDGQAFARGGVTYWGVGLGTLRPAAKRGP
jgi:UDP-N-acetyl-D-mannosaminuronate dehydrogenase